MDFFTVLFFVLFVINLLIFLLAIKVINRKGGIKFVKMFIKKKINPQAAVTDDAVHPFNVYPRTKEDIIFLGDSLYAGGSWSEFYPELTCRNRAVGGESTFEILKRIDNITSGDPKKIFLLVGINDLLRNSSIDKTFENYSLIISKVKKDAPNTMLYIQSILPINIRMYNENFALKKDVAVEISNENINNINIKLKKLCEVEGVSYIDCFSILNQSNNGLQEQYTYDGIHLTFTGYLTLSEMLKDFVNETVIIKSAV